MGESAFVYDVEDIQSSKTPEGFIKVFETDDVMRQGDYPTKFIWYPNSKDIFLCTSSKSDEIVMRDLRTPEVVCTFNGNLSDSKNEQKIEDLKFNPSDSNIFATISKHSTIEIFDIRKPSKSISKNESVIQNYKSNLIDW
jgi:WD40 repeat protein